MFCRKCGNELSTDDIFCGKCGAEVTKIPSSSADIIPDDIRSKSAVRNWLSHPVARFFLYLMIFVIITILLYAVILPPNLSVVNFIKDPRGLSALLGSCMGSGLVEFLWFWPLLGGLSNMGIIPKRWKLETIFLLAFVYEIGSLSFGTIVFSRDIMLPISEGTLILGILVRVFSKFKKKK